MKARIAEITVRGRENVTVRRRATITGTHAQILKKLQDLAKRGKYRSVFGAVDDATGRLIDARDTVERGGKKTSVRISPKTQRKTRSSVGKLVRTAYGIRKSKKRTSKKRTSKKRTSKKNTSRRNRGRRTSRGATRTRRRRTSRR